MRWLLLLTACSGSDDRFQEGGDGGSSCGTWASVGQPILLTHCTSCHSSALSGEARRGAPEGVDLDSLSGARDQADQLVARVDAGEMPPAGGMSAAEIAALHAWVDCGAPGDENTLPATAAPDGLLEARETRTLVQTNPDVTDGLTLLTEVQGGDADGRTGTWSEEVYVVSGDNAWLQARTVYDADGGSVVQNWDPPLLIWSTEVISWTATAWATVSEPGAVDEGDQDWEVSIGAPDEVDARVTDPDATQITMTCSRDRAGGPGVSTMTWLVSDTHGIVARSATRATSDGGQVLEQHSQLTLAYTYEDLPSFPLEADQDWMSRVLVTEAP